MTTQTIGDGGAVIATDGSGDSVTLGDTLGGTLGETLGSAIEGSTIDGDGVS